MVETDRRSDAILRAAGLQPTTHAASGTYALAAPGSVAPGARLSSASVGGLDEFGADFSGARGRALAARYRATLQRLGMTLRSPGRTDIVAFRWVFPPSASGEVDIAFVNDGRRVIEALLKG